MNESTAMVICFIVVIFSVLVTFMFGVVVIGTFVGVAPYTFGILASTISPHHRTHKPCAYGNAYEIDYDSLYCHRYTKIKFKTQNSKSCHATFLHP